MYISRESASIWIRFIFCGESFGRGLGVGFRLDEVLAKSFVLELDLVCPRTGALFLAAEIFVVRPLVPF
ncbi:MAG: hypothetical protein ABGX07_15240, partial [Pirellulaceae bacterium]